MSDSTRRIYLLGLRRLLHDLASHGHSLESGLILPDDFPPRPRSQLQLRRRHDALSRLSPHLFGEIFDACIQTLATTLRSTTVARYRTTTRRFLSYLQNDFPELAHLSELRRDPHLLGWFRRLAQEDPPLSNATRHAYLLELRRLLHDLASQGHALESGLILPDDFPPRPPRQLQPRRRHDAPSRLSPHIFGEIFDACIQTLATTLRSTTVERYRTATRRFLSYLQKDFPELAHLSELRRDPHLLGWFRRLAEEDPPLSNTTRQMYLLELRRLLHDLAGNGHSLQPGLILSSDLPPRPHYLPRPLSPEQDRHLQQELYRTNDLPSNALLLIRATGIRIGECVHLALECLRSLGQNQWALQVPLGKLYTERLVPVDENLCQIVRRILELRALAPASHLAQSATFLLPRGGSFPALAGNLRHALHRAAVGAGCSPPITPHRLRHTYASEMLRLGVSLPALMQLLGHRDIRMTLRYLQVTQQDLQREFHLARAKATHSQLVPRLSLPDRILATGSGGGGEC